MRREGGFVEVHPRFGQSDALERAALRHFRIDVPNLARNAFLSVPVELYPQVEAMLFSSLNVCLSKSRAFAILMRLISPITVRPRTALKSFSRSLAEHPILRAMEATVKADLISVLIISRARDTRFPVQDMSEVDERSAISEMPKRFVRGNVLRSRIASSVCAARNPPPSKSGEIDDIVGTEYSQK